MPLYHFLRLRWAEGFATASDLPPGAIGAQLEGHGARCLAETRGEFGVFGSDAFPSLGLVWTLVGELHLRNTGRRALFQHSVAAQAPSRAEGQALLAWAFDRIYGRDVGDHREANIAALYSVLSETTYHETSNDARALFITADEALGTTPPEQSCVAIEVAAAVFRRFPRRYEGQVLPEVLAAMELGLPERLTPPTPEPEELGPALQAGGSTTAQPGRPEPTRQDEGPLDAPVLTASTSPDVEHSGAQHDLARHEGETAPELEATSEDLRQDQREDDAAEGALQRRPPSLSASHPPDDAGSAPPHPIAPRPRLGEPQQTPPPGRDQSASWTSAAASARPVTMEAEQRALEEPLVPALGPQGSAGESLKKADHLRQDHGAKDANLGGRAPPQPVAASAHPPATASCTEDTPEDDGDTRRAARAPSPRASVVSAPARPIDATVPQPRFEEPPPPAAQTTRWRLATGLALGAVALLFVLVDLPPSETKPPPDSSPAADSPPIPGGVTPPSPCLVDKDGDGYAVTVSDLAADRPCGAPDTFKSVEDCDDNDSHISPGAKERCDGRDNNCDGSADDQPSPEACLKDELGKATVSLSAKKVGTAVSVTVKAEPADLCDHIKIGHSGNGALTYGDDLSLSAGTVGCSLVSIESAGNKTKTKSCGAKAFSMSTIADGDGMLQVTAQCCRRWWPEGQTCTEIGKKVVTFAIELR